VSFQEMAEQNHRWHRSLNICTSRRKHSTDLGRWKHASSRSRQSWLLSGRSRVRLTTLLSSVWRWKHVLPDRPFIISPPSYGAKTLRYLFLSCLENLRLLIGFCLGHFGTLSSFTLHISHGTDSIMTQYDTDRIVLPFGPFDVCI
jgi:hypothetical protein